LGRGLDALLAPAVLERQPAVGADAADGVPLEVELGRIERNPRQPRRQFDEQRLEELAASIREHGIVQPLVVTPLAAGDAATTTPRYQLIAGERRLQAARRAGLVRVPVVVRGATARQLLELALVENVQRADLNPLEEATAYQQLAEEFGMTQEEIGRRVGKSKYAIANTMRLLQLPAALQRALLDEQLAEGHARAILGLHDREAQRRLMAKVIDGKLSVRQTEELVRREQARTQPGGDAASGTAARRPGRPTDVQAMELEERFQQALGTRVSLSRSKRGGRLVIHFYGDEQLQALYDRIVDEGR
jgi:ParB family chromosome partitioning protein